MAGPPVAKRPKPATASSSSTSTPRVKKERDILYDKCLAAKPVGSHFTVQELEEFGVLEGHDLLAACQELIGRQQFVPAHKGSGGAGSTVYRVRSKGDALKILRLKQDHLMAYNHIEATDSSGIWKRHLVTKLNMHENTVTKCLKELLATKLIKEIKSARYPSKRIYMLAHLEPSEENTGGSFFSEGEMDMALVEALSRYVVRWVEERSWMEQPGSTPLHTGKKRKRDPAASSLSSGAQDGEPMPVRPPFKIPLGKTGRPLIPHSSDYLDYPTTRSIQQMITDVGIIKDKSLTAADVQRLLTRLEFDGQLEVMRMANGVLGYRTVRQSLDARKDDGSDWFGVVDAMDPLTGYAPGNGLTQTPCGRCPVFGNCRPGGEISPETCVYMEDWLQF